MNRQLSFMKACDMGDSLIAIDEFGEGIFRIDKADMTSHLLVTIEGIENTRNLYQAVERCKDEIFFFPLFMNAENDIIVYHIGSQHIEYLDLTVLNDDISGDYRPIKRIENSVLLFPTDFTRNLVRFQLDTRQIKIISSWKNVVGDIDLGYADSYAKLWDVKEVQNKLYHIVKKTNYIIEIDKENFNVKYYTIPLNVKLYIQMDCDGEKLWIAADSNQGIISWNPVTQETKHYLVTIPEDKQYENDNWIEHILCGANYLWMIPKRDNKIMRMDYVSGMCEYIDIFPDKFCLRKGRSEAFKMIEKNGNIVDIYPFFSNIVIHLDLKNDILLENYEQICLPAEWSETDIIRYQSHHISETDRISANINLDSFLQSIHKINKKENRNISGETIWKYLN